MASKAAKKRARKRQGRKGWLKTLVHVGGGETRTISEVIRAMNATDARRERAYRAAVTTFTDAGLTPDGEPPAKPRPKAVKRSADPLRFATRREVSLWGGMAREGGRCWDDPARVPLPRGLRAGGHFEATYDVSGWF